MSDSVDVVDVTGNNYQPMDITTANLYIGFGVISIISNFLTIIVSSSNKNMFKKSAFVIGLSVGDIIFGCGLVINGAFVQTYIKDGLIQTKIHPLDCLKKYTTLRLIGHQAPASIIFLIGSERVLGVIFFQWYFKQWNAKLSCILVAVAYGFCFISVSAIWIELYQLPENTRIQISCKTPIVIGSAYATYNYGLSIVCGVSAVITTIFSLSSFLRKRTRMNQSQTDVALKRFIKRQVQMATSMTIIAIIDFALVVVPNILLLMISYEIYFPPSFAYLAAYSSLLYCTRSSLSFFVYFGLNQDFRSAAYSTLFFQRAKHAQTNGLVAPVPVS